MLNDKEDTTQLTLFKRITYNKNRGKVSILLADRCGSTCCTAWLGVTAVLVLIVTIGFPVIIQAVIHQQLKGNIVVSSPESSGYAHFIDETYESNVTMTFYFWNLENPEQVLQGSKPQMREVGPFVYRVKTQKSDVSWSDDKTQITYREHTERTFDPELTSLASGGRIDNDQIQITNMNLLFFGALPLVGRRAWEEAFAIDPEFNTDMKRLFTTRTVHEWIFGYSAKLIKSLFKYPGFFPNFDPKEDPDTLLPSTLWSGVGDINRANTFVRWRNRSSLFSECPWGHPNPPLLVPNECKDTYHCCYTKEKPGAPTWASPAANNVAGLSNAGNLPAPLFPGGNFSIFSSDLQRALIFTNDGVYEPTLTYKGVEMYRYIATNSTFENAKTRPENSRYYMYGPDGVVNLTRIERGVPIFISLPHFLWAPALQQQVLGMEPNEPEHDIELWLEPISGLTMMELERSQINIRLTPEYVWGKTKKKAFGDRELYIPTAWFTFEQHITDKTGSTFALIYLFQNLTIVVPCILAFVALGLVVLAAALASGRHRQRTEARSLARKTRLRDPLLSEDGDRNARHALRI